MDHEGESGINPNGSAWNNPGEAKQVSVSYQRSKKIKLWNVKVTVWPAVVEALGRVPKKLDKRQGEQKSRERIKSIGIITLKKIS